MYLIIYFHFYIIDPFEITLHFQYENLISIYDGDNLNPKKAMFINIPLLLKVTIYELFST